MGYRYPNLLVGTRSNPLSFYTIDKILVGMRMRFMLVEGTEPRAWAPADGEVWPR